MIVEWAMPASSERGRGRKMMKMEQNSWSCRRWGRKREEGENKISSTTIGHVIK